MFANRETARSRIVALSSVTVLVLIGCSPDTTDESNDPPASVASEQPTSTATSTSSAAVEAKHKALAAYRGMWQDFVAAGRTSDWQSPGLGQHATGVALQNLSRGLYADHQNGVVTKGEPVLDPSVSSTEPAASPRKVVITDCGDSTDFLKYDAKTGQPVDDEPGGRQLINAIAERQSDGSWKVSDFGVHEVGSCG